MCYGIKSPHRPWPATCIQDRINHFIRHVRNLKQKRVILIEDERVTLERSAAAWEKAVELITDHLNKIRADSMQDQRDTMYAIETVRHYSRFYSLMPGEIKLYEYPTGHRQSLEFKKDKELINTILLELVSKTH